MTQHADKEYLRLLTEITSSGQPRGDRTGTGTISVFNPTPLHFPDVNTHFPLLTTKRVPWKSVLAETLWFTQGRTDLKSLREDGCTWWDDWALEDDSIGPGYGNALRQWYTPNSTQMVEIPVREDKDANYEYPYITEFKDKIPYDLNSEECWVVGHIEGHTPKLEIQFQSGYLTSTTRANWWVSKKKGTELLRDGYQKTASGVGFKGYPRDHDSRIYNLWYNMLARCYNPEHPQYARYGGTGVTVSPVWHSFEIFLTTLVNVPGYHQWRRGLPLQLDKDYFGSEIYGPSTTVFLTSRQNNEMTATHGKAFEVQGVKFPTPRAWAEATDADEWHAMKRWESQNSYRGIASEDVRWVDPSPNHLWRRKVITDQLAWVINEIKTNPTSRRLVLTMWNAGELDEMALPPCHGALIQFYARNGDVLDLLVHIRSSDVFLGLPTNIAGYALLLLMVAQVTGRVAGDLKVSLGDAHLYKNHLSQAAEQMSREIKSPSPCVGLDPDITDIDDFRPENFALVGYYPYPAIPAPISV